METNQIVETPGFITAINSCADCQGEPYFFVVENFVTPVFIGSAQRIVNPMQQLVDYLSQIDKLDCLRKFESHNSSSPG